MPKTPLQETFSQGLVTSRPPHMLSSGELTVASNTVYRPNNVAIQRAPEHGLYSTLSTADLAPTAVSVGVVGANFDSESTPIQLILRNGADLFNSGAAGPDGNSFSPVTFPGRVTGTFEAAPYVDACVFSTSTKTVNAPTTGAFDNYAVVGRPIVATSACPMSATMRTTEYIITGINYSGGHISSITLNNYPAANTTTQLLFCPKFTPVTPEGTCFYSESRGFTAVKVADVVTTSGVTTSAPARALITGLAGTAETGTIPGYPSCYLNYYPTNTESHDETFIFSGGIGRAYNDTQFDIFDGISWDGTCFLWDGFSPAKRLSYRSRTSLDANVTLSPGIVARPVGLLPVEKAPTITQMNTTSAEGAWNSFLTDNCYYWFIITEAFIPSGNQNTNETKPLLSNDLLESAYLGKYDGALIGSTDPIGMPVPVWIDAGSSHYIQITTPPPRNDGSGGHVATHWVIYMSSGNTKLTARPSASSLHRVAVIPITNWVSGQVIALRDKRVLTGPLPPYTKSSVTNQHQFRVEINNAEVPNDNLNIPPYWPFATNLNGRGSVGLISESGGAGYYPSNFEACEDFHFKEVYNPGAGLNTNIGASVATTGLKVYGIEVHVAANATKHGTHNQFSRTKKAGFSLQFIFGGQYGNVIRCETADSAKDNGYYPRLHTFGGKEDTWGLDFSSISSAELGQMKLRVAKTGTGSRQFLEIFRLGITIYWTGTTINLDGPVYKCVSYTSQAAGVTVSDPAALKPPVASTGDAFQGSLVLNDIDAPTFIKYSLPDRPEYFPSPYRIRLGTKKKGKVTCIKSYKNVLIVGMENCIKQVSSLPKELDSDFTQKTGEVITEVTSTHGIVGPNAAEIFDMPGMGQLLAYVSVSGLRMTNGADTRALNTDVTLSEYVHANYWDRCLLKNYPVQKWLVLYYVPVGSTHGIRSKSLVFSYSEDHIKGGAGIVLTGNPPLTGPLPATGPNDCYVVDATEVMINSVPSIVTTDGLNVFVEDSTASEVKVNTTASDTSSTRVERVNSPVIKTRDIFPGGFTMDSNLGSLYIIHDTQGTQNVQTLTTSTVGSTTVTFSSAPIGWAPVVGERIIHGGWDNVTTVLEILNDTTFIVSSPAVRSFTGDATFDSGNIMVRVNAAMFGEDATPILTEYRSTSVGVGQAIMLDATANRFSVEISKVEDPNTGVLTDLNTPMSIVGIVYHASSSGETSLHTN